MFRLLRSASFKDRIARVSGVQTTGAPLTSRSKLALTAGFLIAASGVILIGPNLVSAVAEPDDHASFWRAEHARKSAARQAAQPAPQPARSVRRDHAPQGLSSYAPISQQQLRLQARPAQHGQPWRFERPDGSATILPPPRLREDNAAAKASARSQQSAGRARSAANRMVCVRLCDGYFFPAPVGISASDASCASACPNAPTRLFSMRSDRIADAVSARDGTPYARLPVALHYTRTREQACSYGARDPMAAILADATLRRGDRFMTESGFLIYQGGRGSKISAKHFTSLSNARGLPRRERELLVAIERVSLPRPIERLAASPAMANSHVALGPPRHGQSIALR